MHVMSEHPQRPDDAPEAEERPEPAEERPAADTTGPPADPWVTGSPEESVTEKPEIPPAPEPSATSPSPEATVTPETSPADDAPADALGSAPSSDEPPTWQPPLPPAPAPGEGISATPTPAPGEDPLIPPSPLGPQTGSDVFRAWDEPAEGGLQPPTYSRGPGHVDPYGSRPPRNLTRPLPADQPRAEQPRRPRRWVMLGVALLSGIVGAGLALGGFLLLQEDEQPAPPQQITIREQVRTQFIGPEEATADPTAVAQRVIPSIVSVQVGLSADEGAFQVAGSGSGVVLSDDGYIVTNDHVVADADRVQVTFSDGRIYDADVLGTDPLTDLAVLKISATGLIPIEIGSTADLKIGDVAIAAGSPLGLEGGPTVTVGVISAFGRQVQTGPGLGDQLFGMIQTDAPITRGSSGGGLVDGQGRLIGITTAVGVSDVGVEGIGFAIPVELVQRITDELIEGGAVTHAFLGIEGRTEFEDQLDGSELPRGVFVQSVVEETGAAGAGLVDGDIITEFDGEKVSTMDELIVKLRRYRVGDTIELTVERDGVEQLLTIELGPRPDET